MMKSLDILCYDISRCWIVLYGHKTEKNVDFRGNHLSREKVVEFTVYLRKEGRITVPKEVRVALNIGENDLVKCQIKKLGSK